ncbi:hypothetical protein [Acetobacterium malicum]|uniref:hypothetical protein n=1 Tax=Acetobacterium malicum TaxID=52692 RepID=UPI0004056487|nr:hypothetical protein [Acetobacterium dehalogenans]
MLNEEKQTVSETVSESASEINVVETQNTTGSLLAKVNEQSTLGLKETKNFSSSHTKKDLLENN